MSAKSGLKRLGSDLRRKAEIERLIQQDRWAEVRLGIRHLLREEGGADHWLMARMGLAYYEERRYREALEWSRRAIAAEPRCPLARWEFAGALQMLGRLAEAKEQYQLLARLRDSGSRSEPCWEGKSWAEGLRLDAIFRLATIAQHQGESGRARKLYLSFIRERPAVRSSIYSTKEAKRELASLQGASH